MLDLATVTRAVSKAECNTVNESTLGHYHSAPALLA